MSVEPHIDLREVGELWRQTPTFRKRLAAALEIAGRGFGALRKPYLAISGGKDSVAMAGVVDQAARQLRREYVLWSHVSDASFPGTEETVIETARRLGREVVIDRSPVSAFDVVGKQSARQFGKSGYFFSAIARFVSQGGYDLAFVGIRAAESRRRRVGAINNGSLFPSKVPVPHWKCCPLTWWTIQDVAAALVHFDLPIHPIYAKIPVGQGGIRLGYATALDLVHKGTVVFLRRNYPDLYRRLAEACPEVSQWT